MKRFSNLVDGVPVTVEIEDGEMVEALIGERGQYVIKKKNSSISTFDVYFMQMGDNGPYRSSNCYTDKWFLTDEKDINVIIKDIVDEGYFPECPEWVKLNTYTPDMDAPILTRVWSAKYQPHDRLRDKRFDAWRREVEEIADSMSLREKSFFRALGEPACDFLNIMSRILYDVEGISSPRDYAPSNLPDGLEILSEEEHLLCLLFLDIANAISISNDDWLVDPEWEDPIPRGSCYLEDLL